MPRPRARLRALREARGWSAQHLADATRRVDPEGRGISHRQVYYVESGETRCPRDRTRRLLCRALGERYDGSRVDLFGPSRS